MILTERKLVSLIDYFFLIRKSSIVISNAIDRVRKIQWVRPIRRINRYPKTISVIATPCCFPINIKVDNEKIRRPSVAKKIGSIGIVTAEI